MTASRKSDEAEGRASLNYADESDDVRSLLSEDGADFVAADAQNSNGNAATQKNSPWTRMMAALGWGHPAEHLPYYALQQRGRPAHPKPRSRGCVGPCLRYFIAYASPLTWNDS
jgi:hypothetical protein